MSVRPVKRLAMPKGDGDGRMQLRQAFDEIEKGTFLTRPKR